jgi:hypothetical protein
LHPASVILYQAPDLGKHAGRLLRVRRQLPLSGSA